MSENSVIFEIDGGLAVIALNRSTQRNCVDAGLADGLREALARFEAVSNVSACGTDLRFS